MNKFLTLITVALLSFSPILHAEDAKPRKESTPAQQAQREKMKSCNQEAKTQGLKGDERKAFMRGCLSKSGNDSMERANKTNKAANREKARQCKEEAREKKLKGDERKAYVSTCLEG